jgi:16S rRNA (adenine1518-N6/adenine1519-N6)-dimethyltransferase
MRSKTLFAKKSLGQNFLVDADVIEKIIGAFDPRPDDIVLEIGPGRGALTERLVDRARKVYALEFDRDLVPVLREKFNDRDNFTLVEGDALELDFATLERGNKKLRLIANLPYNISTAVVQRLFSYTDIIDECILMFQREVAQRIMAPPGTKDRGYLSVMTELYFSSETLFDVQPAAFRPVPKVWSSVIRLISLQPPHRSNDVFGRVVAAGFAQKRKTIGNNLKCDSNYLVALSAANIEPMRRAESLTLDEWLRLSEAIASGDNEL